MRTRLMAACAAATLAFSLGIAGCSGSDGGAEATGTFPGVSGEAGSQPTIDKGKGKAPAKLASRVITEGDGATIKETDTVCVDYVGQTWDGKVFDHSFGATSEPRVFSLQQVVAGWTKGLAGKKVGDRVEIVIPPDMGYGDQEQRDAQGKVTIPKNSTLVFVVDIHGAIDATDTKALTKATPNAKADIPSWLHVKGDLGKKPEITIDANAEAPTEQKVIILAEGKGERIEADDYVAAHVTAAAIGEDTRQSTYDMGAMQVTNGPIGQSVMYNGIAIGTRAIVLTPAGKASNGMDMPAGVYVVDYGAKMNGTRSAGK